MKLEYNKELDPNYIFYFDTHYYMFCMIFNNGFMSSTVDYYLNRYQPSTIKIMRHVMYMYPDDITFNYKDITKYLKTI